MDWKEYEREIAGHFQECYPSARIIPDAKVLGRYSKVERQIDLLIEEVASDFSFRIVIDAKFRGRSIDLNDVEAFLGLISDVGAHTGMMIALEGYTPAALRRAYYDELDIVLDVLNFDELKTYQGVAAIPFSGKNGVCIGAPLGWVIDGTRRPRILASLYQRGCSFDDAVKSMEWMYVNFFTKMEAVPDLASVVKHQEAYLSKGLPGRKIEYMKGVPHQIRGAETLIRKLAAGADGILEFTGFVDFPEFVFLCVLFTPPHSEPSNLRKLRFVMRGAFQMSVVQAPEPVGELPTPRNGIPLTTSSPP
jgi:hypothetical protein